MVRVEGKYIYFRKFMLKKRDVVLLGLGLLVSIGIVGVLFSVFYKTPEDRELVDIVEGKMRMIGGQVVEVSYDKGMFVLDRNPLGQSEKYTIYVNKDTQFSVLIFPKIEREKPAIVGGMPIFEDGLPKRPEPEEKPSSFSEVRQGIQAEVHFKERVDISKKSKLWAKSVKIIKL